jgi:hypothetical protein
MENVGTFYAHMEYIAAIWYILCSFGNLEVIWYISPRFLVYCVNKNLATLIIFLRRYRVSLVK